MPNWKTTLTTLSVLIAITFYFIEGNSSEDKAKVTNDEVATNLVSTENNTPQTVSEYSEIFKEETLVTEIEKIQAQQELTSIDDDVETLIAQADKLIEENSLVLPEREFSLEEKEKLQELDMKLKIAQQELEELSYEN